MGHTAEDVRRMGEAVQRWHKIEEELRAFRYQTIEEVPFPREIEKWGDGAGSIDPKVRNLVRVLNPLGLTTMGSCEGHLDDSRFHFPWVTISGLAVSSERREDVQEILEPFNSTSPVRWIAGSSLEPATRAIDDADLAAQQASAEALAQFLFDRYLKGKHPSQTKIFGALPRLD